MAGGGSRAGGSSRPERPPQQRFASVEDHWRKLTPEQRHELLRLPVRDLLAGARPSPSNPIPFTSAIHRTCLRTCVTYPRSVPFSLACQEPQRANKPAQQRALCNCIFSSID